MPIDLGILGLILSILVPALLAIEGRFLDSIDPKGVSAKLETHATKVQEKLAARVFREMDDDVISATLYVAVDVTAKKKATQTQKSDQVLGVATAQAQKRQYTAHTLTDTIWGECAKHMKMKACYEVWRAWAEHGRSIMQNSILIEFLLFLVLAVLFFTKHLPATIPDFYYWIALAIAAIPLTYVFVCTLVADHFRRNFDRLSEDE